MNKKILKLENNKEYFTISTLTEDNITYLLLMNVDDESDVKIVQKVLSNGEDFIVEVQGDIIVSVKEKFKSLVDSDKKLYI